MAINRYQRRTQPLAAAVAVPVANVKSAIATARIAPIASARPATAKVASAARAAQPKRLRSPCYCRLRLNAPRQQLAVEGFLLIGNPLARATRCCVTGKRNSAWVP